MFNGRYSQKIKIIVCRVDRPPTVEEIDNTLKSMQEIVDGLIEIIHVTSDVIIVCNEEGRLKNKRLNPHGPEGLVGDFFICSEQEKDGDVYFASLSEKQIVIVMRRLLLDWYDRN